MYVVKAIGSIDWLGKGRVSTYMLDIEFRHTCWILFDFDVGFQV